MNTTTRMPAAALAAAALLALTGCAKTTSTSTSTVPHCTAVRTASGDLVTSQPRPCLLTDSSPTPHPTTTTPTHQPAATTPTKTTPATAATETRLRKDQVPVAKIPAPARKTLR